MFFFPHLLGYSKKGAPRRPQVSVGEYLVVETDIFESFSWSDSNIAWLLSKFSVSFICLRLYDCTTPKKPLLNSEDEPFLYVTKWDDPTTGGSTVPVQVTLVSSPTPRLPWTCHP